MSHFYFIEEETGEEFIVGAYNLADAFVIAKDVERDIASYYGCETKLSFEYIMTDDEAEASGLDEY